MLAADLVAESARHDTISLPDFSLRLRWVDLPLPTEYCWRWWELTQSSQSTCWWRSCSRWPGFWKQDVLSRGQTRTRVDKSSKTRSGLARDSQVLSATLLHPRRISCSLDDFHTLSTTLTRSRRLSCALEEFKSAQIFIGVHRNLISMTLMHSQRV